MLPDYPEIKSELNAKLQVFLRDQAHGYLGPLSKARRVRLVEGHRHSLTRSSSGVAEATTFVEASASFEVKRSEIPDMSFDKVIERLDSVAADIASQVASQSYEVIAAAVKEVGNETSGPPTADTILEALSKIEMSFRPDGTPILPDLVMSPRLFDQVKQAGAEFEDNPEQRRRFDELVLRKREEWRAREASRRLVG